MRRFLLAGLISLLLLLSRELALMSLDAPLTVGNLIVINGVTIAPILVLLVKGVWYLSRMVHQHDQMWLWFNGRRQTDMHGAVAHGENGE